MLAFSTWQTFCLSLPSATTLPGSLEFSYTAADVLFLNSLSPVTLYTFEIENCANQIRGPKSR